MSLLPPSWTNTVSVFRPQESLTRPVNRHTSLIRFLPAALSSFLSPRDSHSHAHTHSSTQKHKQTPVKYLTTLLSLHRLCHHLLYCISLSVSLPVLSAHLLSLLSFLPSLSSVHLFTYFHGALISPWPERTGYIPP